MTDHGHHLRRYPTHHGDAARTDVQFALQWDRRYRQLLPEVIVLHLESERAAQGANWKGRTTRPFGRRRPTPRRTDRPRRRQLIREDGNATKRTELRTGGFPPRPVAAKLDAFARLVADLRAVQKASGTGYKTSIAGASAAALEHQVDAELAKLLP